MLEIIIIIIIIILIIMMTVTKKPISREILPADLPTLIDKVRQNNLISSQSSALRFKILSTVKVFRDKKGVKSGKSVTEDIARLADAFTSSNKGSCPQNKSFFLGLFPKLWVWVGSKVLNF